MSTQTPPTNRDDENGKRPTHGALLALGVGLACLLALALLLGSGATSAASEPGAAASGPDSDAWLAGWVLVFLALAALYAFDRLRAKPRVAAAGGGGVRPAVEAVPAAEQAADRAERAAAPAHRPIELLLKKKPSAAEEKPRPPAVPAPRLNLPEDSPLLRRPPARSASEPGEESFSVAQPEPLAPPPPPGRLERCAALRAEARFEEAAGVAREGLAAEDGDAAPFLIELSRAELGLGHVSAAIDTARDAHFAGPSRESISHLIHLLVETRRFACSDGPTLRRAAARHPEQPLLRHAFGVFESMYGEPSAAERELRAALGLAADPEQRAAIERDLAQLQGRLAG